MKKIGLLLTGLVSIIIVDAQTMFVPNGTTNGIDNSSNQNVGIGVGNSTPRTALDIISSNRTALTIGGPSSSVGAVADINFQPTSGSVGGSTLWTWSFRTDNFFGNPGDFALYSHDGSNYTAPIVAQADGDIILGGGTAQQMNYRVGRHGNVGIGTTTPTSKLHVELPTDGVFNETALMIEKSKRQLRFIPKLSGGGMNPLSQSNDFGIFWNDGASGFNGEAGLVIAPHTGSANGIRISSEGNVGIGTNKTSVYKLSVEGKIRAREIEVNASVWADFVFADGYELNSLAEVEEFIEANNHLPNVPSEKEVTANGINLGEMDAILLRKIEELTLYVIAQQKDIVNLKNQLK